MTMEQKRHSEQVTYSSYIQLIITSMRGLCNVIKLPIIFLFLISVTYNVRGCALRLDSCLNGLNNFYCACQYGNSQGW